MRKKIIICALSVLLLILSGVLAFYLHGQNRPIAGFRGIIGRSCAFGCSTAPAARRGGWKRSCPPMNGSIRAC